MTGPYAFLNRANGVAECTVSGDGVPIFLNRCASAGVPVLSAMWREDASLTLMLRLRDTERAAALAAASRCKLLIVRRSGIPALRKTLLRRVIPVLGLLCFFALLLWSKLFIWEMDVSGNEHVSAARVLNALSECGIRPGSFWPAFTSDNLRSELLLKLPELAWATVNIHGSRAEVIVRERVPKPMIYDAGAPTALVAGRVGFVTGVQTLNGTARVRPGSAVVPGEMLIEGVAQSAFSGARELHALGSVQAETYYEISAELPTEMFARESTAPQGSLWAIELGRKRINFYRNSSICRDNCDKIEKTWEWKKEGLFSLPVRLVRIRFTGYSLHPRARDAQRVRTALEQQLRRRLLAVLGTDGSIAQERFSCGRSDGNIVVCLHARCSEEIAVEKSRTQEGYP